MAEPEAARGRTFCYRCHKPSVTCICAGVPRVRNRTHVRLVQHPRERFHPIGTARIARLGLENVALEVVHRACDEPPSSLPEDAALLYPGDGAGDLASLSATERPSALVVVDGTWAHARTIFRDNAWLRQLPRYGLAPPASRYRLRREPALDCVSTIEAIVEALRILEPDTAGLGGLLSSFDAMIDQQLTIIAERGAGGRKPARPSFRRGGAAIVASEPERLVVVAGEAAPREPGGDDRPLILQWAARRVGSGEMFERFVCPPAARLPSPCHLAHMGLDAALFERGGSPSSLHDAWRAFLRPSDVVVSWSQSALSLLAATAGPPPAAIQLKSLYCSRTHRPSGTLDELLSDLGVTITPNAVRGRAGHAIAALEALLGHIRRGLA